MIERDMRTKPYTKDESRVCDYLRRITEDQIGCGDDPIGFLIACHASLMAQARQAEKPDAEKAPPSVDANKIVEGVAAIISRWKLALYADVLNSTESGSDGIRAEIVSLVLKMVAQQRDVDARLAQVIERNGTAMSVSEAIRTIGRSGT